MSYVFIMVSGSFCNHAIFLLHTLELLSHFSYVPSIVKDTDPKDWNDKQRQQVVPFFDVNSSEEDHEVETGIVENEILSFFQLLS